jgi:hypothetical protein
MLGLLIEKMEHPDYNIEEIMYVFKQDLKKILKALFSVEPQRHVFDVTLANDFRQLTKPYAKAGFEIEVGNDIFRNVPVVGIKFVPEHEMDESEIQELIHFLSIKFREYLSFYWLNWRFFVSYSVGTEYIIIYIYYAELAQDYDPFRNVYRQIVRNNVDKTSGYLRDKELEDELKNVAQAGV